MKKLIGLLLMLVGLASGMSVQSGEADVITYFVMRARADGTVDEGVVIANLVMYYIIDKSVLSADVFTGAIAITANHTDGGAVHVDWGVYRVDWPDAAFVGNAGTKVQLILIDGDSGAFTEIMEVEISPPVDAVLAAGTTPFDSASDEVLSNIVKVQGDAVPDNGDGTLDVLLADGVTHTIDKLVIDAGTGTALTVTSSGGNGHAALFTGNGSGEGVSVVGGTTGHGVEITAGGGATGPFNAIMLNDGTAGYGLSGTIDITTLASMASAFWTASSDTAANKAAGTMGRYAGRKERR